MTNNVKVRFAPSPTGKLHIGNARVAVLNWLFARHHGGSFLLRMDDTDTDRSKTEFEAAIIEDLDWLGLSHDAFARQSERMDRYEAAMERMRADGRLYPCYETPEELELRRKVQLGRGLPPVYDRAALKLGDEERKAYEAEGRRPHWRFLLNEEAVEWTDLARGHVRFEPGHLSDPVLVREDGRVLYTLSSVVDDGEMGITHVIRGEDHVANTAVQVQLFKALGYTVPGFAHLPLLVDADGKGLSKRIGSLGLSDLKAQGIEPRAIIAYLAHLGTALAAEGGESIAHLISQFDIGAFGRASPRFDPVELSSLNAKVVHGLTFSEVSGRLEKAGIVNADETFWETVRGNISTVEEATHWWTVMHGTVSPVIEPDDQAFLEEAAELLKQADWKGDPYGSWIGAVKQASGRKGKALFMPIRKALTARDSGPELRDMLPLIGLEKAQARLRGTEA